MTALPPCSCGQPAAVVTFSKPIGSQWRREFGAQGFAFSWCGSCVHDLRDDVRAGAVAAPVSR